MNSEAKFEIDTLSLPLFVKIWLTSVFLVAAGSAAEAAYGGNFGQDWLYRMMLLAAVPLVTADRFAILRSMRAREVLGKRFRIFATNTVAGNWVTIMVLISWPSLTNFPTGITIWFVGGIAVGIFSAKHQKIQMPDIADQYLELDQFQIGDWLSRTSYMWWVPFWMVVLLSLVWVAKDTGGQEGEPYVYLQTLMFLILVCVGVYPSKKRFFRHRFYWTQLVGTGLFLIVMLGDLFFR